MAGKYKKNLSKGKKRKNQDKNLKNVTKKICTNDETKELEEKSNNKIFESCNKDTINSTLLQEEVVEELAIVDSDEEEEYLAIDEETEYFSKHYYKLPSEESLGKIINNPNETINITHNIKTLKGAKITQHIRYKNDKYIDISNKIPLEKFGYFPSLMENYKFSTKSNGLTDVESSLLQVIGRYSDLYYTTLTVDYQNVYLLHLINHVTRNRCLIMKNIDKLKEEKEKGSEISDALIDECRDQGFTRTKTLILVPYKKCVYEIVKKLKDLMFGEKNSQYLGFGKFEDLYNSKDNVYTPNPNNPNISIRTEEYAYNMDGNVEDNFRIGIAFSKKALKLFTKFDESDVIIASPLGLIGAINDAKNNGHNSFLSSIEIAIFDRVDIFQMQNWENVLNIINNLNKKPDDISFVDITRIRNVFLNDQGKALRQTLMFSRYDSAEIKSAFIKASYNYAGYITIIKKPRKILDDLEVRVSQEITRLRITESSEDQHIRFKYFVDNVYPRLNKGTLIFIPSYYDYVQVKSHFIANNKNFADLNEYAAENRINSDKIKFSHGLKTTCLLTERFHYYNRLLIKGIKSIYFYQLPNNPHFFSQLINMSELDVPISAKITFTDIDSIRLRNIYGSKIAKELLTSNKDYHMMLSE
uniref:U3 small nucleolar RNA-associated protein 25 n=1 Tax=Parastrongyloides trichosuri TaxID=131310 RepID=A0A0N4ZV87_PARTI